MRTVIINQPFKNFEVITEFFILLVHQVYIIKFILIYMQLIFIIREIPVKQILSGGGSYHLLFL